jgi:hypothetical protein
MIWRMRPNLTAVRREVESHIANGSGNDSDGIAINLGTCSYLFSIVPFVSNLPKRWLIVAY